MKAHNFEFDIALHIQYTYIFLIKGFIQNQTQAGLEAQER